MYGGAVPDTPVLESLPSHWRVMHYSPEPSGTNGHSHLSLGRGYNRGQPDSRWGGGGYNVSTPAPLSATVDSLARPDYPLVSENPAEAKSLRYNGSLECGLFYAKFRTLARYYGWTDDDSLLALSVSVEGPALKYFHFLYSRGG